MSEPNYDKTRSLCWSLALLACQAPLAQFLRRHSLLEDVHTAWISGRDVVIVTAEQERVQELSQKEAAVQEEEVTKVEPEQEINPDEVLSNGFLTEADDAKDWLTKVIASTEQSDEDDFHPLESPSLLASSDVKEDQLPVKKSSRCHGSYPCTECPQSFLRARELVAHSRRHRQFVCRHCGQKLSSERRLTNHERLHVDSSLKNNATEGDENAKVDLVDCVIQNGIVETTQDLTVNILCIDIQDKKQIKEQKEAHVHRLKLNMKPQPKRRMRYACKQCPEIFDRSRTLAAHEQRHSRHECRHCGARLSTKTHLEKHERRHELGALSRSLSCTICARVLSDRRGLEAHIRTHTGERPYVCCDCGRAFGAVHTLRLHMRLHSGYKPYMCVQCGKTFAQSSALLRHRRIHTGKIPYNCAACGSSFRELSSLIRHRRHLHPELHTRWGRLQVPPLPAPIFECHRCGKALKHQSSLDDHMRTHTNERPYLCTICPQTFKDRGSLQKHKVRHGGEKPFICAQCGAAFPFGKSLKSHMMVHSDARPHVCVVCSKAFKCVSTLRVHERMHTGERPYVCSECAATFREQSALIRHRQTHTGERPHKCTECNKGFRDTVSLRDHARTHSGDRPLACTVCDAKFAARGTLQKHMRCMHTCDVCNKVFPTDQLRQHKALHVNGVTDGRSNEGLSGRGEVRGRMEEGVGLEKVTEQEKKGLLEIMDQREELI